MQTTWSSYKGFETWPPGYIWLSQIIPDVFIKPVATTKAQAQQQEACLDVTIEVYDLICYLHCTWYKFTLSEILLKEKCIRYLLFTTPNRLLMANVKNEDNLMSSRSMSKIQTSEGMCKIQTQKHKITAAWLKTGFRHECEWSSILIEHWGIVKPFLINIYKCSKILTHTLTVIMIMHFPDLYIRLIIYSPSWNPVFTLLSVKTKSCWPRSAWWSQPPEGKAAVLPLPQYWQALPSGHLQRSQVRNFESINMCIAWHFTIK